MELDQRPERTDEFGKPCWYSKDGSNSIEYSNGSRVWFKNGMVHREDGPAIIYFKTGKKSFYINGERISEEEFLKRNE